jgi:hypothetical protein
MLQPDEWFEPLSSSHAQWSSFYILLSLFTEIRPSMVAICPFSIIPIPSADESSPRCGARISNADRPTDPARRHRVTQAADYSGVVGLTSCSTIPPNRARRSAPIGYPRFPSQHRETHIIEKPPKVTPAPSSCARVSLFVS